MDDKISKSEGKAMGVAAAAMLGVFVGSGAPAQAHASMSDTEITAAAKTYEIPGSSIATALNHLADLTGVRMIYRAKLTQNLATPGLKGRYTLTGALDRLLAGTNLTYQLANDGRTVSIVLAQNDTTQTDEGGIGLPTVEVEANKETDAPGSSQAGAGLGGRFTGYTVDLSTPAVVTKDNVPILQTPANIQVVPREVMDDQQDISLRDAIVGYVSSVQTPSTTPDSNNFYDGFNIRGIDNVNIYRDDLRVWEITGIETANLQSVEVLKGPAAFLFGRMEPGGVVNLVVKRPLDVPYYSVQEQTGSWGLTRTTVDATGPLTNDKTWLYRINLDYTHNDNAFTDFVTNQNAFIGPTITYHPIEQFRLNIDAEYQNTIFVDNANGFPAFGTGPAPLPITRYIEQPEVTVNYPNRQERELAGYDWTFDLFPDWSLTNRFAYNNNDYRQRETLTNTFDQTTGIATFNLWDAYVDAQTIASNLDLKGKFETGPFKHDVLIGTDYWYLDKNIEAYSGPNPTVPQMNIFAPVYSLSGYVAQPNNSFYPWRENWKGVYGQDMISFADDRLHLLLGGRYDWAEFGEGSGEFSNFDALLPYNSNTGFGFQNSAARAFSPRLGAVVQPVPWLSFYGDFTRSLGVTNVLTVPGQPLLPPQVGTQYEGGAKAEFFDKRLTATLAFYDITMTNVPQAVAGTTYSTAVGLIESKGAEFDISGRINTNWSLITSYAFDDARILSGTAIGDNCGGGVLCANYGTTVDESGNRLQDVPLHSGSIWVKYDASGDFQGLSLGGGVVAVGRRQGDNQNDFQLSPYARVDAMILYHLQPSLLPWIKNLTAQLNIKNLFNTAYYQSSSTNLNIFPGAPRTFLVSLRAEF
ncbi:MAG TPA: TonB-dependent receptor [Methylocella sp.]|nr:TonB-dependent receptor [Methylocella sp.]